MIGRRARRADPGREAAVGAALWLLLASHVAFAAESAPRSPSPASPTVELSPARVRPGDAFLVKVRGAADPATVAGTVAGRPLAFFRAKGAVAAFGALPLETPAGRLPVEARVAGRAVAAELAVEAPAFPRRELQVDSKFVTPPPPEIQARIDEDRAAFARAFSHSPAAPLFTGRFVTPRKARVTAGYGEERTFNAVRPSQHYGQDLAGKVGAPVVAANAGEVVLSRDCWASGWSVILWHGAGVYTTYFHLSKVLVKPGQRVDRGQRIGLVGRTGRVSGPHLHWGVRIGDLYVDPASALRLAAVGSAR